MWQNYQTSVPAKWILAGEHAVLRGVTAIALPHPEFKLTLSFQPQLWPDLKVAPMNLGQIVRDCLEDLVMLAGPIDFTTLSLPRGSVLLESNIPMGAGLGSSAALCVALVRWGVAQLGIEITDRQLIEAARKLENRFHGQSSGLDVAASHSGTAISYSQVRGAVPLGVKMLPRFTFHDTGLRAATRDCVAQVEALIAADSASGTRIDEKMAAASRTVMDGLVMYARGNRRPGLARLAAGITQAQSCFEAWGLVPEAVQTQIQSLRDSGAVGVKLTGAGNGGYLVALWDDPLVMIDEE